MNLAPGTILQLHLIRVNGALREICTDLSQAEAYMRKHRRNGEYWRITPHSTLAHQLPT